jgi:glutamate racemase
MKIGFFDSGLGGLTILKAVSRELQDYDYVYYGDTANIPYGDKTEEEIYELTVKGMEYLFEADCALVIIACNTASSETAKRLQQEFIPNRYPDRKILGIIVPTIEALLEVNPVKVVLLATKRTVDSKKYLLELHNKSDSKAVITALACPELVPLIELNELVAAATQAIHRIETQAGESDVVVLGCTHYTQIKSELRKHFGLQKKIISQDEIIPEKIRSYLLTHPEIEQKLTREGGRSIHLTRHRPDYDMFMGQLLGGVYMSED